MSEAGGRDFFSSGIADPSGEEPIFSPISTPLPMDLSLEIKPSSRNFVTPRRKLSMSSSSDENTPQLRKNRDTGLGDTITDSCFKLSLDSMPKSFTADFSMRSPLSEVQANVPRKLVGNRNKASLQADKENMVFKDVLDSPSDLKFHLPFSPSTTTNTTTTNTHKSKGEPRAMRARSLYRQLSSPMSRMSLMSPTSCVGSLGSQRSSRPSSTASNPESDGYFSEVFEGEEAAEEPPLLSPALSSLIFNPSPMTTTCSNKSEVLRPTPMRPLSYHEGDQGSPCEGAQDLMRRGSLKRCSPMSSVDASRHKKHCHGLPPVPFFIGTSSSFQDSPPSSSSSAELEDGSKSRVLLRSQSLSMPRSDPLNTSFSPGGENLIGDNSKPYALPLLKSSTDLKSISPDTLCGLLDGKFDDEVNHYTILDCRFPYEYEGGHVRGARNVWTREDLLDLLFKEPLRHPKEGQREVFILHCEFSSKRGPKMSRFLRETDRKKNGMQFPKLFYPELYLLEGGYKAFFAKYPGKCEPQSYCCMDDKNHTEELRTYKLRSKSWHGDTQARQRITRPHRHSISSKFIKY